MDSHTELLYRFAKEKYLELGVDTDAVLKQCHAMTLSIHCWQGDDVGGFEKEDAALSGGGILSTGSFPGKARTLDELREDVEKAFSLIPAQKKLNLHAIYGDFQKRRVDRDKIESRHFQYWIDWALQKDVGIDFNPTLFSHPMAESGYTLASRESGVRDFWKEHVSRCRQISDHIGKRLQRQVVNNIWLPDGSKDITVNRLAHRRFLRQSLDEIFETEYPAEHMVDSLESKLFGIGSESYVVGSHEFYLLYACMKKKMITYDTGHFHPTETVSDKISSTLLFFDKILLHLSRGIRWDSDHVVILSDELVQLMQEIQRAEAMHKVHFGLDFFDGSINRIAAWVIGSRAVLKSMLFAMLEPTALLQKAEEEKDFSFRLFFLEAFKTLPFGIVWDYFCKVHDVPSDLEAIGAVKEYGEKIAKARTD